MTSDYELWRTAAGGNPDAFAELFRRHADAVYNHCFRRTGSWESADDLTSVVFLETWRRRRRIGLEKDGSLLPWLLGVANAAVKHRDRTIRRHRRLLAKLANAEPHGHDPSEDVVARTDDERRMQKVLSVFNLLTPTEQDVLALVFWARLSYEDAAVALGVPVGTVRSRVARARIHLQSLLERSSSRPRPATKRGITSGEGSW